MELQSMIELQEVRVKATLAIALERARRRLHPFAPSSKDEAGPTTRYRNNHLKACRRTDTVKYGYRAMRLIYE